ncbi:MAG: Vitamin B12 transporter BtuB, partial [Nitrospiraceae bacterium]
IREGAQASGAKGPVDFALSLSRWDTSSFSAVNYKRGAAERDGFHNWQASGRLGVALPKDGRLDFNLRWWNSDVNLDSAFVTQKFDVFGSRQTTRTLILSGTYDQPLTSWWSQRLTIAQANERLLFFSGTLRRNLDTGVTSSAFSSLSDIETLNRRLEWQHNFQVGKPVLLTVGYQFREEQGENPSIGPQAKLLSTHAGFAQARFNFQDRLLLTAGVRQDSYNVFGDATTYRVTAGYLIPETGTKFRASYATGFRAPTINQLFFPGFGNPNLKPEESKSLDAGVDQRLLKDRLQVSAGYFWNRFQNLIVNVPAGALLFPQNVGQAKSQGWEVGFQYAVLKGLDLRGQYTYTLTRDLSNGTRLPRWPVHQASVGVSYRPIESLGISLDYRYVGSRFNDTTNTQKQGSFGVVNVAVTYDVTKQVQIFGRIENLFNQDYEEILFFGSPIRSVFGGVRISL